MTLLVLLVAALSAAVVAQEPNLRLWNWAASGQVEPIRKLLSAGSPRIVDSPDAAGWTALMHAADAGHDSVVRVLLDAGANTRLQNTAGETALHLASQRGQTAAARLLLQVGAAPAARDAEGRTPLFRAIEGGHAQVIALLHAAAVVDSDQRSPVLALVVEGDTVAPVIVQWTDAPYTDEALMQGIEGTVVLTALVRADGSVGAVSVKRGVEKTLDQSALLTVRTWKFAPATRAGRPVAVVVEVSVDFTLPP